MFFKRLLLPFFFSIFFPSPASAQPPFQTLHIVYESRVPIQGDLQGRDYVTTITKDIDIQNNRMRRDERALGWESRGPAPMVEITAGGMVSTVAHDKYILLNQRPAQRDRPVWAHPRLGRKVGEENILGRPCDVWSNGGGWKVWLWNDIDLRTEMENPNAPPTVVEAREIMENAPIDERLLDVSQYHEVTATSGNVNDVCRLDNLVSTNITRQFYESQEECLARLCDVYGPANAAKGTSCRCIFDGKRIREYIAR